MRLKIIIVFVLWNVSSFSQNDVHLNLVNDYLKNAPEKSQLSIAIIQNGETTFLGAVKENNQVVFVKNEEHLFEIGSITKVFTATILAQLISEGKIKSTATVDQLLKFKLNNKTKIKLTELANHTSGLPPLPFNFVTDQFIPANPYKNYKASDFESYLKHELKLNTLPGTSYNYSNLGAGLLGYSLAVSQKKTYSELLQTLIFDKYGLTNTFPTIQTGKMVVGLDKDGKETSNWDFDALAGAGCIVSCTRDLAKFARAQFENDAAIQLTHTPTFTISETMKIALGWHLISQNGQEYIWHNGGTGGYSSSMALNLQDKGGVIVLSNNAPNGDVDELCFELLKGINSFSSR